MSTPPTLVELLAELPDPRDPRGRIHPLGSVLSLAIVATLGGCRSLAAISQFGRDRGAAFAHALGFRRGKTPASSTLSELFRDLDAAALDRLIGRWLSGRHAAGWAVVTLDGKTLCGSRDGDAPAVHLLAAYAPEAAAVIGQLRVDAKTNEHKAALRLLGVLPPLGGAVVTADAMFTHRDVAEKIRESRGHYLLPVKDNQATLLADLTATFVAPATFSRPNSSSSPPKSPTSWPQGDEESFVWGTD
jgi:DDE_Tnp_1-associated/Transposase DDE domain